MEIQTNSKGTKFIETPYGEKIIFSTLINNKCKYIAFSGFTRHNLKKDKIFIEPISIVTDVNMKKITKRFSKDISTPYEIILKIKNILKKYNDGTYITDFNQIDNELKNI